MEPAPDDMEEALTAVERERRPGAYRGFLPALDFMNTKNSLPQQPNHRTADPNDLTSQTRVTKMAATTPNMPGGSQCRAGSRRVGEWP